MKKIKKIISLIFYYGVFSHLPNDSFPGGKFYNWLRIFCLKRILPIGENCRIQRNVYVGDGDRIRIGNNCRINEGIRLCNVKIGDNVLIARCHVFVGAQHKFDRVDIPMVEQGFDWGEPTIIKDDVWIGINCLIMPGLVIEKGSILGGGSIMTKNSEPYGIYVGNPAKMIKKRL